MSQHDNYHYSVSILTDDEALLHCLRALSQYAQVDGNTRIPWGGTKKGDWERENHRATFRFSRTAYRNCFIKEIQRLLPNTLFKIVGTNDSDPAKPQTRRSPW